MLVLGAVPPMADVELQHVITPGSNESYQTSSMRLGDCQWLYLGFSGN